MTARRGPRRILIAGGGFVGLYTALWLERLLGGDEAQVTLVSPDNYMLYQPLLPEVASGTLSPRHVIVPLRLPFRRTRLLSGVLTGLDADARSARVRLGDDEHTFEYDEVVLGLGSEARVLPIPGLAEHAVGFQSLAEAIHLRNHLFDRLEAAEASDDPAVWRRALTFVFVGGGYTGVEAIAELEDLACYASRWFPGVRRQDQRWVLVEATDRILPIVDPSLSEVAAETLRRRGIEVHLNTRLESAVDGRIELSTGERFEADTLVWVAGTRPHPLLTELGVKTDDGGRVVVDECLRAEGVDGVWAAGDCAAVPDAVRGGTCPPSAQYAERQARRLARNLAAKLQGRSPVPFRYGAVGEIVTLGRYKAVGEIYGRELRGFLPWFLRRIYYASRIPTRERKVRLVTEWTVALFFPRDPVDFSDIGEPRAPLRKAADPERVV